MAATPTHRTGVHDEISPLRRVLVHGPGPELERLTPETREELLFDEVLWLDRARAQHRQFTSLLRGEGVEVLQLTELLEELLLEPALREHLLARALDPAVLGDIAVQDLRGGLADLEAEALVDVLIGGITVGELRSLGAEPRSIALQRVGEEHLVLDPLPNHLFTRDTSAWIGDVVSVGAMRRSARRRESLHLEMSTATIRASPGPAAAPPGGPRRGGAATVEGGDVMMLSRAWSRRHVGAHQRRRRRAAGRRSPRRRLGGAGDRDRAAPPPLDDAPGHRHHRRRRGVDAPLRALPALETFEIERPGDRLVSRARPADEMDAVLARGLGVAALRVLTPPLDAYAAAREQWDDGCNVLASHPGGGRLRAAAEPTSICAPRA